MRGHQFPVEKLAFVDGQGEDVASTHHLCSHVVKDKITQAINDELALVELVWLDHVGMSPNHEISAAIDGSLREVALVASQTAKVFDAPMHKDNHKIG